MKNKPRSTSMTSAAFKIFAWPVKALIALVVFVDEIARPIYRPAVRAILGHPVFGLLDKHVSVLPRWAILICFAIPFLIAEPLKLVAVILFAKGKAVLGVVTFLFAQLMTFVLVERIFHAGRGKLMTYWWLAWVIERAAAIRDALHAMGRRVIRRIRAWIRLHA